MLILCHKLHINKHMFEQLFYSVTALSRPQPPLLPHPQSGDIETPLVMWCRRGRVFNVGSRRM